VDNHIVFSLAAWVCNDEMHSLQKEQQQEKAILFFYKSIK
jgi:hypothetical protein